MLFSRPTSYTTMSDDERLQLQAFLNNIHPLGEQEMDMILDCFRPVEYARKHVVTEQGQTEQFLYFVLEGLQRAFYVKEGREHNIVFTYPPSFSGVPESFLTQTPSRYFLDCLSHSRMVRIRYDDMTRLVDKSHAIERLLRIACQEFLGGLIQRHYELLAFNMEERFEAFMQRSKHLVNIVPQKHLASYLGIDPTNFSKLMNTRRL